MPSPPPIKMHLLKLVFLALSLCLLQTVCVAYEFKAAPPAIWQKNNSTLAISGRRQKTIGILVKNVCPKIEELSEKKAPYNLTTSQCAKLQFSQFMGPMENFCSKLPKMPHENQFKNVKRLFGHLLGLDSVFPVYARNEWRNLSEEMENKLDLTITNRDKLLKGSGFNLNQLEASELKESFKVTLLTLEKLVEQHIRNFDENEPHLKFLEKLGVIISEIDGNSVAANSSLISCEVMNNTNTSNSPANTIVATLDLAIGQKNDSIYQAVPFVLYDQDRNGLWCKYEFASSGFGFVNRSSRATESRTCFSSQAQISYLDCKQPPASSSSHFKLANCSERTRPIDILQVKLFNNKPLIYCPGLQISIGDGPFEECPNHVFELQTWEHFKFNETSSKNESIFFVGDEEINGVLNKQRFGPEFQNWKANDSLVTKLLGYWYYLAGVGLVSLLVLCCCFAKRCCQNAKDNRSIRRSSGYVDDEEDYEQPEKSASNLKFLNSGMSYEME